MTQLTMEFGTYKPYRGSQRFKRTEMFYAVQFALRVWQKYPTQAFS